jgi:plastocyanin
MNARSKIICATTVVAVAGAAGALMAQQTVGPQSIAFPAGFATWERYQIVHRHDTKQYRELYAKPEVVKAVRDGKPIPDGTVLALAIFAAQVDASGNPTRDAKGQFSKGKPIGVTVMEKRAGWGNAVPAEWRNGDWQYAAFTADGKPNEKANANIKACFECHLPHAKQDFVISLAGLSGTAPGAAARPSGPGTVAIAEFLFGPEKITVKAGDSITWTNVDDSPHQVTIQGATTLRTPVVLKGQTTSLQFNDVGSYGYICGLHPSMKGQIEVVR